MIREAKATIVETKYNFRIYRNGDMKSFAPFAKRDGETLKEFATKQMKNSEKWGWTIYDEIEITENSISYTMWKEF